MRKFHDLQGAKEYVRERSDLMQMISDDIGDVEWKNESGDVYVCCSPFRDEANPSFKVHNDRFKDWGGEQYSGDIFTWTQIWHNVSFPESIAIVAKKFKVDIDRFYRVQTAEEQIIEDYFKINAYAAEIMHHWLRENIQIRDDYLSRSGFTLDQIEPYQVGYSASADLLVSAISNQFQLSQNTIERLEFYRNDMFTNAIVYPVHNHLSNIVGFYSKSLKSGMEPYIGNRASHPLHDPSVMYGLHVARKDIRDNHGRLIVVEGFRDAIAIRAAGCMGSSISEKQLETLSQFKLKTIIAAFDGDTTGWTKSLDLINKPLDTKEALLLVSRPDDGLDPHDMWKRDGDEAIEQLVARAKLPIVHYVETKFEGRESLTYTDQQILLSDIREFLSSISGIQLDMAATYIASITNSTKESIIDFVAGIKASQNTQLVNVEAEKSLVMYCIDNPAALAAAKSNGVKPESFSNQFFAAIFRSCISAQNKYGGDYTPQSVIDDVMARNPNPIFHDNLNKLLSDTYRYPEAIACDKVLDMWRRRSSIDQASNLIVKAGDLTQSFTSIVESHRKTLISTISSVRPQARTPSELASEVYGEIKDRHKNGGSIIIGHSFHQLPSLDLILGGIQPHYTVIGGDSGSGKSLLAMNIAKCLAIDLNVPLLWIGQEMKSRENMMRLVSMITKIDNSRIQSGQLSKDEGEKVRNAITIISRSGMYYAKPSEGHIDEILSIVDEYRWKYGIQAIIWDYVQLVTSSPDQQRESREQVIGNASKAILNKMVGDGLIALIVAQLNRDKMAQGQHKIAGSYQIIQDCDNFVYIQKKTKKQIEEDGHSKGNRKIFVSKRRGGASEFELDIRLHADPGDANLLVEDTIGPMGLGKLHGAIAA